MSNFNVELNIKDCTFSCNCRNCDSNTVTVTSSSQTISLQNNFLLNVIATGSNFVTILIQNGFQVIIRNIRNFPTQICIPSRNCTHIVTVSATIN